MAALPPEEKDPKDWTTAEWNAVTDKYSEERRERKRTITAGAKIIVWDKSGVRRVVADIKGSGWAYVKAESRSFSPGYWSSDDAVIRKCVYGLELGLKHAEQYVRNMKSALLAARALQEELSKEK